MSPFAYLFSHVSQPKAISILLWASWSHTGSSESVPFPPVVHSVAGKQSIDLLETLIVKKTHWNLFYVRCCQTLHLKDHSLITNCGKLLDVKGFACGFFIMTLVWFGNKQNRRRNLLPVRLISGDMNWKWPCTMGKTKFTVSSLLLKLQFLEMLTKPKFSWSCCMSSFVICLFYFFCRQFTGRNLKLHIYLKSDDIFK